MRKDLLSPLIAAGIVGVLFTGSAQSVVSDSDRDRVRRAEAIARAQVWTPVQVETQDIRTGPDGRRSFAFRETVTCDYSDKKLAGHSPKFACVSKGDDLKVKFGAANAEVFAEVAATRLLWALGFGADRMYPVRVVCRGCPDSLPGILRPSGEMMFDPATIERKMAGDELKPDSSWVWAELDQVREDRGGAPRAHRDALKLMAVFLQHTDSKPEQQRIVCRGKDAARASCTQPFMMINDLGLTFGGLNAANTNTKAMSLVHWTAMPIWKDKPGCVGNLRGSFTGTLEDPVISEAGREFLAKLLTRLSDDQISAIFDVARVTLRLRNPENPRSGLATVAEWSTAFKAKRADLVSRRCQ
jgi:hypothetical protein